MDPPNRRFHRIRQFEEGFIRPIVYYGTQQATNVLQNAFDVLSPDPEIVWDDAAQAIQDAQQFGRTAFGIGSAAAGLIPEVSSYFSSSRPDSDRPRKRLRGNDWLKLSPPGQSPNLSKSPANSGGSTFPLSLYSAGLRKADRWTKSLKWFRTRLLLRSRARKRTRGFRARSAARQASRRVDKLQRYTRKLQRTWRTSEFKFRLRQLAKAKRQLWLARRRARKYGR